MIEIYIFWNKWLSLLAKYGILSRIEYVMIRWRSNHVVWLAPVKRETGANPVRTRHRN